LFSESSNNGRDIWPEFQRIFVNKIPWVVAGVLFLGAARGVLGTELKPATAQAFDRYVEATEAHIRSEVPDPQRFLRIDSLPEDQKNAELSRLQKGEIFVQSMTTRENGEPIHVPGGLVHNWLAIAFIPGASAEQVLKLEQDYSRYAELYKPDVQEAKVLTHEDEHFRVYYRFYRHAIVTVVYNVDFDVDYFIPDGSKNYSFTRAVRIAEVESPGTPLEREYAVGKDHGYMWRLNLYTRCVERDGGVYVQVEFLALSRTVPAVFAWLVNPYVHSIPRDYLRHYLEITRKAVTTASPQ
jgi:hypothetical protein